MIIKTCGLREADNIASITGLDVDWIGLIFYPKSPRFAGAVASELSSFLQNQKRASSRPKRVGVFVNETFENLMLTINSYELDFVQLHGGESAVFCSSLRKMLNDEVERPVGIIRAFRVSRAFDFAVTMDYEPFCDYFIFDTKAPQVYGGTGHKFDWTVLERYSGQTPFLLSGGIGPSDADAVAEVAHPALAGVDVNSRFELEPGLKDVEALTSFIKELRDKK